MSSNTTPYTEINILLIDDDPISRMVIDKILRVCGYTVEFAEDGGSGLEKLKEDPGYFDLVLCDVSMPVIDGFGVLDEIRSTPSLGQLTVIMLSTHQESDIILRCLESGADDYLLKPVRLEVVKNLWQQVWKKQNTKNGSQSDSTTGLQNLNEALAKLVDQEVMTLDTKDKVLSCLTDEFQLTTAELDNENQKEKFQKDMQQVSQRKRSLSFDGGIIDTDALHSGETQFSSMKEFIKMCNPGETVFSSRLGVELMTIPDTLLPEESDASFDAWSVESDQYTDRIVAIFDNLGLLDQFDIDQSSLAQFVDALFNGEDTHSPFFNTKRLSYFCLSNTYLCLTVGGLIDKLSPQDTLSLCLAVVSMAAGHPLATEAYLCSTNSETAIRFNYTNVIHNCIVSNFIGVFLNSALASELKNGLEAIRKMTGDLITRSRFERHSDNTKALEELDLTSEETFVVPAHRQVLAQAIVNFACNSFLTACSQSAKERVETYQQQLFAFGDQERQQSLKTFPFANRDNPETRLLVSSIASELVRPTIKVLGQLMTQDTTKMFEDNLETVVNMIDE